MTDMTERAELLTLADRVDKWANLVSSGYEVPAAGKTMTEAASALRRLAAQDQKPVAWRYRYEMKEGAWGKWTVQKNKPNWYSPDQADVEIEPLFASPPPAAGWNDRAANASAEATYNIGRWLSAALEDPNACEEFKHDIRAWMDAGKPNAQLLDASAEARLREVLEHYAKEYCEGWCEQDAGCAQFDLACGGCLARRALSAHPHASDCDKQGKARCNARRCYDLGCFGLCGDETTKSEGGVQESPACNPDYNGVKSPALVTAHGLSGQSCPLNQVMPDPSDRTADVTAKVRSAINGIYGLRFFQLSGGHQEDSIEKAIKKIVAIVEEPCP